MMVSADDARKRAALFAHLGSGQVQLARQLAPSAQLRAQQSGLPFHLKCEFRPQERVAQLKYPVTISTLALDSAS